MRTIAWQGPPPPEPIAAALSALDFHLTSHEDADPTVPLVVSTGTPHVPIARGGRCWIWLCRVAVPDRNATAAVLRGAYAVLTLDQPPATVAGALVTRLEELLTPEPDTPVPPNIVMESAASKRVIAQIARAASTSMSVLLTGETGTGKEVMAHLLHAWSPRCGKPFVPINCAAIPDELMEAELFGYARGAFSGAVQRYDGQLMAAEGGTVFLDEIDDTPLATQVKLLRVLEDHVVNRLGESVWHTVNFRVLAATNRDLRTLIAAGLFGADLYQRLAIVTIQLTPLRDRLEDLPVLARQFIERFAKEEGRDTTLDISPEALRALAAYAWPGNIRELRNVIYQTLVYKRAGTQILVSDLPRRILRRSADTESPGTVDRGAVGRKIEGGAMNLRDEVAALERIAIEEALKRAGGNAAQAARMLGRVGRGVARDPGGTVRAMVRRLTPK